MRRIRFVIGTTACLSGMAWSAPVSRPPAVSSTIAFVMASSGGSPRPIVTVRFNGHPMRMMIHSNAGFYAQLKHDQAAAFGVALTGEHTSYGIDRGGHVSDLGRDAGVAATLGIGDTVDHDAPVAVFEVPQDDYGMLGVEWIGRHRLILDYAKARAIVSPRPAQVAANAAALKKGGYVALPMRYDVDAKRYTVIATIGGVSRPMTVASASEMTLDRDFALRARRTMTRGGGGGSGPTGTFVPNYTLDDAVRLRIGAWVSRPITGLSVEDVYGYMGSARPADPASAIGGYLGGSFLVTNGAVIDFGAKRLYLRRT